jgi:hypothetical protein
MVYSCLSWLVVGYGSLYINHKPNHHDLKLTRQKIKYIKASPKTNNDITILSSVNYENNKATRVQPFNAQGFVNRVKRH